MTLRPRDGFVSRMKVYLAEMYPIPPRVLGACLASNSFLTILGRIHDAPLSVRVLVLGAWSVCAITLMLRLMDELKDAEVDRTLFPSRPLASRRVLPEDIGFSIVVVMALFLCAHLGDGRAFASALIVLGYALLMFRWFFVPGVMQARLFLTLATHTPIIPLLLLHLLVLFVVGQSINPWHRWRGSLSLITVYWALFFAWEISRKIRAPEEENAYVTYSRLLGPRWAVLLAGGVQTLALGVGIQLVRSQALSRALAAGLGIGYAVAILGHGRFLLRPDACASRLRPFAEGNLFCVFVGGCLS